MPAVSVDTFFACSLMVMLVLSAMAITTKLVFPSMNVTNSQNLAERYRETSRYLLLNTGKPPNWGQNSQTNPETFGLARPNADSEYDLDRDKVSRMNTENAYAISYLDMFVSLEMPDLSFRIKIEPLFKVSTKLAGAFISGNGTIYEFEISTDKHGAPISAQLKIYVVAGEYLNSMPVLVTSGKISQNITIPNSVAGPALLIILARSSYNDKIVSFDALAFAHNSSQPNTEGTLLRLSPLNFNLNVSLLDSKAVLAEAHALTFGYNSTLSLTSNTTMSATYAIPHFLDTSTTVLVVTGSNSTTFFTEWTTYPQIPAENGANLANSNTLSSIFSFTYAITIDSAIYECTIWVGGLKE
jgi:hypothetical protein